MTRVVVVEDHTLVRQSLVKVLAAQPGLSIVGEAGRGDEALQVIASTRPNLVLLDIGLPGGDGLFVATQVKESLPEARILFLTMHDDEATIRRAVSVGADGYVPKSSSTDELLRAVAALTAGGSYLSPPVARRVMELMTGRGSGPASHLTDRELEILRLLAHGVRATEAAAQLCLSVKTVKNHLTSIYAKLGVEGATQAVAKAYRLGLVRQAAG